MELHLLKYSVLQMIFTKMYSFLICKYKMKKIQSAAYYHLINLNFSVIFT